MGMTDREKVIKALECCKIPFTKCYNGGCPYFENDGCKARLKGDALALLKAQEPRVMTLEEVKRFVYGTPYIIETNLLREEPRLIYGLYSHQGVNGCFYFAFTDARSHFFDADYGKRWRCWTSRPTDEQRAAEPWPKEEP